MRKKAGKGEPWHGWCLFRCCCSFTSPYANLSEHLSTSTIVNDWCPKEPNFADYPGAWCRTGAAIAWWQAGGALEPDCSPTIWMPRSSSRRLLLRIFFPENANFAEDFCRQDKCRYLVQQALLLRRHALGPYFNHWRETSFTRSSKRANKKGFTSRVHSSGLFMFSSKGAEHRWVIRAF